MNESASLLERFLESYYVIYLISLKGKALVLTVYAAMIAFCTYGSMQLEVGENFGDFMPKDYVGTSYG